MAPIILQANQPPNRFYRGGAKISEFRSVHPCGEFEPEDWVASTTCCSGQDTLGLTRLPNGTLLVDEIQANPTHWLGTLHIKAFGTSTKLLVKLLDAGQRLPVHAHPHRDWARQHLNAPTSCGKAEIWFIVEPGTVHIGLRETVPHERLKALVDAQDADALLGLMHVVRLERGMAMYVPPGTLHAIGEGMFIIEIQEPSDLSVLCEWQGFDIDGAKDGHMGLGFDVALTAVDTEGKPREQIEALISGREKGNWELGAEGMGEYFRIERHAVKAEGIFPRGFAVVVVYGGELELLTASETQTSLRKGSTVVVPYADGDFVLMGEGEVLIARPPRSPGS